MKKNLLFVLLLAAFTSFANTFTEYQQHIATDRILLMFNSNINPAEKDEIIKASGLVSAATHLPTLNVSICFVNDYAAAQQYFAAKDQVSFVSFFITTGQHYAGVTNRFFVKLTDKNFEPQLREQMKAVGITEIKADKYVANLYLLTVPGKTQNTVTVCENFSKEAWCQYASPDYLLNPLVTSNDALYARQWAIDNTGSALQGSGTPDADMDVDSAWTITTGSSTIKVAIVDSGVDTLHNDLRANLLPGHDAVGDSTDGYPTPNHDEDGHGTCCAGIVAAIKDNTIGVSGVAPASKLIPVRAFFYTNNNGTILPFSTASIFADAIGWSWNDAQCDIMSHSWGLPPNLIVLLPGGVLPVEDAIQAAFTNGRNGKGCAMFFSSGNEGGSTGPIWPARLSNTIAVNATSMCDEHKNANDCSGENWGGDYGTGLDFSAPGVRVATTDMRVNKGFVNGDYYYTFNGTSAACPNAAAVGALVLAVRGDLTANGVRDVIAQTCDKVGGYGYDSTFANGTWCKELGYGRVNAYRAVQFAGLYSSVSNVAEVKWNVFPNPANAVLHIQATENGTVRIYNTTGQQVMQAEIWKGNTTLDVWGIASGVYLVQLQTSQGTATRKVTLFR